MEKFIEAGKQLGLSDDGLLKFISEQQTLEREERSRERRESREAEERKIRAEQEHQLEMKKLEVHLAEIRATSDTSVGVKAKALRLPAFVNGKDELDSYLLRIERFAATSKWPKTEWATSLSALLTGRALDVYSRMSDTAAVDYDLLKQALLNRYDLTEEGYRSRFRETKPEVDESSEQFIVRLTNYLHKWVEMSGCTSWDEVSTLLVKEQFVRLCPKELSFHLKEQIPKTLKDLAVIADQFLTAHGRNLVSGSVARTQLEQRRGVAGASVCFNCAGQARVSRCVAPPVQASKDFRGYWGEKESSSDYGKLPVRKGLVGNRLVDTLRDTGCTGVIVKKEFVNDDQLTGDHGIITLLDPATTARAEVARICVDTPYYKGEVEALCFLPNAVHDLIIGNIPFEAAARTVESTRKWGLACGR
ncbi:LOW QUALITY PROTEIN: uncharacterized protein LOC144744881 [Ciona intestinalis]